MTASNVVNKSLPLIILRNEKKINTFYNKLEKNSDNCITGKFLKNNIAIEHQIYALLDNLSIGL